MTKETFYQEVDNLVEDYIHNNNSKPNFLLINSKTLQNLFDEYDNFVGLMIVLSNDLFEDELVVYWSIVGLTTLWETSHHDTTDNKIIGKQSVFD